MAGDVRVELAPPIEPKLRVTPVIVFRPTCSFVLAPALVDDQQRQAGDRRSDGRGGDPDDGGSQNGIHGRSIHTANAEQPSAGRPGLRWSVEMSETAIARSNGPEAEVTSDAAPRRTIA